MRLLSLDPSSTAIGWAVFDAANLYRCGVCRPKGSSPIWGRIRAAVDYTEALVIDHDPRQVVIEVTSGRPFPGRAQTSIVGLALAQGAVYAAAELLSGDRRRVYTVTEQDWTNKQPKQQRARLIQLTEPVYQAIHTSDKGLDAADAVGLGHWWIAQQRLKGLIDNA